MNKAIAKLTSITPIVFGKHEIATIKIINPGFIFILFVSIYLYWYKILELILFDDCISSNDDDDWIN